MEDLRHVRQHPGERALVLLSAAALVLVPRPALSGGPTGLPADARRPPEEIPTPQEAEGLRQLVSEIEGVTLYARYTGAMPPAQRGRFDGRNDPKNWVVEKIVISKWKLVTLGERTT